MRPHALRRYTARSLQHRFHASRHSAHRLCSGVDDEARNTNVHATCRAYGGQGRRRGSQSRPCSTSSRSPRLTPLAQTDRRGFVCVLAQAVVVRCRLLVALSYRLERRYAWQYASATTVCAPSNLLPLPCRQARETGYSSYDSSAADAVRAELRNTHSPNGTSSSVITTS